MAEYSFPPGLIAVNTNSSSFFRLFCRFWCLPNCFHSLTPLQTAPPQKVIRSVQSPSSPPSPSSWAEWSGCPHASNRDRLLPPPANSQQMSVSSLQFNRQKSCRPLQGDCSSLRWHCVFQCNVPPLASLQIGARLQSPVQSSKLLALSLSFFRLEVWSERPGKGACIHAEQLGHKPWPGACCKLKLRGWRGECSGEGRLLSQEICV